MTKDTTAKLDKFIESLVNWWLRIFMLCIFIGVPLSAYIILLIKVIK